MVASLLLPMLLVMKTDTSLSVPRPGHAYIQLQRTIREALRREHPEWVQPNGESPICEAYESRFAKLLGVPSLSEYRSAA
jgi:hypothetical protein